VSPSAWKWEWEKLTGVEKNESVIVPEIFRVIITLFVHSSYIVGIFEFILSCLYCWLFGQV